MTDKRPVSTDALETLGKILSPGEKRDAIHLATISVVAGELLAAGESIKLIDGRTVKSCSRADALGIVDPFLEVVAQPGDEFWMVIKPRVITSLRHVWTHPLIPDETPAGFVKAPDHDASELWLRNWCNGSDVSYDELILLAETGSGHSRDGYGPSEIDGDYLIIRGNDAHGSINPEVWDHVRVVIGKEPFGRPEYFSCSC